MRTTKSNIKIAMFWEFYEDDPTYWSSTSGINHHLKKMVDTVDNYHIPKEDKSLGFKEFLERGKQYDACILWNAGSLREGTPYWRKDVLKDCLLVLEAGDEPQAYQQHVELSNQSDLVLTTDLRCVWAYKQRGINAHWFNSWCNEQIFYPSKPDDPEPDLGVITTMYGDRKFESEISSALGDKYLKKNGLEGDENGEFFRRGKMIFQQARWGEITRRIFEGMGCRKLVFTDYLHPDTGIYGLFQQREDIIYYGDANECIQLMNYFLEHDEEREEIANNGYEKILKYHSSEKRAQELLDLIEKLIK